MTRAEFHCLPQETWHEYKFFEVVTPQRVDLPPTEVLPSWMCCAQPLFIGGTTCSEWLDLYGQTRQSCSLKQRKKCVPSMTLKWFHFWTPRLEILIKWLQLSSQQWHPPNLRIHLLIITQRHCSTASSISIRVAPNKRAALSSTQRKGLNFPRHRLRNAGTSGW